MVLTEDVLDKRARYLLGYTIPHTFISFRWYYLLSPYVSEHACPLLVPHVDRPWLPTSDYFN